MLPNSRGKHVFPKVKEHVQVNTFLQGAGSPFMDFSTHSLTPSVTDFAFRGGMSYTGLRIIEKFRDWLWISTG